MSNNIQIKIESPVKYYDFVDQHGTVLATLKLVPTDLDIFDRFGETLAAFEEMQEKLESVDQEDAEIVMGIKQEATELFKEKIDYLFGTDASGLFSFAGPLTLMGGEVWGGIVLEKVLGIIEDATGKSMAEINKNQSKKKTEYLKKYPAGKTTRKR